MANRRSFQLWHGGLLVHLGALLGLGLMEAASPTGLLRAGLAADALLILRMIAGLVQLIVSWRWLRSAWVGFTLGREESGAQPEVRVGEALA